MSSADQIAQAVLDRWRRLPKTGKPVIRGSKVEWTVLAGVVVINTETQPASVECVALGTGVKCLPESALTDDGTVVFDSHAEVIARRHFIRYLLDEMRKAKCGEASVLAVAAGSEEAVVRFAPTTHTTFHMYVSQAPCGDASMEALAEEQTEESRASFMRGKRAAAADAPTPSADHHKRQRTEEEAEEGVQRGRRDYARVGLLRTKPGRVDAEPTRSMSCSDKIARWQVVGWQGALLAQPLTVPIRLTSLVVGGDLYHAAALQRAFHDRVQHIKLDERCSTAGYDTATPLCLQRTRLPFDASQSATAARHPTLTLLSAGDAIGWRKGLAKPEVLAKGRRQGASRDRDGQFPARAQSTVCKRHIFQTYQDTARMIGKPINDTSTYRDAKQASKDYQHAKQLLMQQPPFHTWPDCPERLQSFVLPACRETSHK